MSTGLTSTEDPAATSGDGGRFFRCPHCGGELDRLQLVRFWNEWGVICHCPHCDGEVGCPAFSPHPGRWA